MKGSVEVEREVEFERQDVAQSETVPLNADGLDDSSENVRTDVDPVVEESVDEPKEEAEVEEVPVYLYSSFVLATSLQFKVNMCLNARRSFQVTTAPVTQESAPDVEEDEEEEEEEEEDA